MDFADRYLDSQSSRNTVVHNSQASSKLEKNAIIIYEVLGSQALTMVSAYSSTSNSTNSRTA